MLEPEASSQPNAPTTKPMAGYGYFIAGASPAVTDDETEGFSTGSLWFKATATNELWVCIDATAGAALWKEIQLV